MIKSKSLHIRLILLSSLATAFLLTAAGWYLSSVRESFVYEQTQREIKQTVEQLKSATLIHENGNLNRITAAERIAALYLTELKQMTDLSFDTIKIPAKIAENGSTAYFSLNNLVIDDANVYKNSDIVNTIQYLTNTYVSLWQKHEEGYIRITSNLPESKQNEALPIFVHNGSQMVQNIEDGKKYYNRKSTKFDSEFSVYRPLILSGYIKIIIQITIEEGTPIALQRVFEGNRFYENKQLFFLNADDSTIINPELNTYFKNSAIVKRMKLNRADFNTINENLYENGDLNHYIISYLPMPGGDRFAGIIFPESGYTEGLSTYNRHIYLVILILGLIFLASIRMIYLSERRFLTRVRIALAKIAQGVFTNVTVKNDQNDPEKRSIVQSVHDIAEYFHRNSDYAKELSAQNFDIDVQPIGDKDVIGQSLSVLRNELRNLRNTQTEQIKAEELRETINSGVNAVNAVLQYATDTDAFFTKLLHTVTQFLNVQQAGLFAVERPDEGKPYLELKAHYAFGKERLAQKQIGGNDGLVGLCFMEKKRIVLREIPQNYAKIVSGFGETEPVSIVLVPMIFNTEVHAVVEIAAIYEIEEYKIGFLESIGESIASTLSSMNNTRRTAELLEQTKEQSKQIETQRIELQERIDTHRRQNKKLDKELLDVQEIINSIKSTGNIIEFDLDGSIVSANEGTALLVGTSPEQLVGKMHAQVFESGENLKASERLWKTLSSGKAVESREKLKQSDGRMRAVYVHYLPIRDSRRRVFRVLALLSVHFDD